MCCWEVDVFCKGVEDICCRRVEYTSIVCCWGIENTVESVRDEEMASGTTIVVLLN